jgi:tRNA pseudouridine55 synthase
MAAPVFLPENADALQAGWVVSVDKPLHWTSFDVVNKLKYAFRRAYGLKNLKIGHAGTLDPLATGVLVVCAGRATKEIETHMAGEKAYRAILRLGYTTASYDAETALVPFENAFFPLNASDWETWLPGFRGTIQQRPPVFSALKMGGKTLYHLARKGETVDIPARPVHISSLEVISYDAENGLLELDIVCGKGTYIRSLAHDLGQAAGCGAYLYGLQRTRVGDRSLDRSVSLPDLLEALKIREAGLSSGDAGAETPEAPRSAE